MTHRQHASRSLWDKFWRDQQGRVVIGQPPNWPIIAWAVVWIIGSLWPGDRPELLRYTGSGLLLIWGSLELLYGVNYFRRALGLIVVMLQLATLIR